MSRSKLPDFDAERPPELGGLPILSQLLNQPPSECARRAKVALAFGDRSRSRLRIETEAFETKPFATKLLETESHDHQSSIAAGILLPRGSIIRGGLWVCGEGLAVQVLAADEDLIEVSVDSAQSDPELLLLRAAYHLGNRHVPLQLVRGLLKLEYDYVLVDMLITMGLKVQRRIGPFEPEWGAYAQGQHH